VFHFNFGETKLAVVWEWMFENT